MHPMKKEFPLPAEIDALMRTAGLQVEVLSTDSTWFGVTYQADAAHVAQQLKWLHQEGCYPPVL